MASLLSLWLVAVVLFVLPAGFLHAAKTLDRSQRLAHWAGKHLW